MERFHTDGHLTDEALAALIRDGRPDELSRLEIAEHLSFCDVCLQRYTDLLSGTTLLEPERSCSGRGPGADHAVGRRKDPVLPSRAAGVPSRRGGAPPLLAGALE